MGWIANKTAAAKLPSLESIAAPFLDLLDPDQKFRHLTFKWVSRGGVRWLGICVNKNIQTDLTTHTGLYSPAEISIQKGLAVDMGHLTRVVAHEVCHHIAINETIYGKTIPEITGLASTLLKDAHGQHWLDVIAKVNAAYGADFITQTSDMESNVWEAKEAFLFIAVHPDRPDAPFFSWAPSVTARVVDQLKEQRVVGSRVFIVKSTNRYLLQPAFKGPGWVHANRGSQTESAILEAIQQSEETGVNLFADYASGVKAPKQKAEKRWSLVMVRPLYHGVPANWINAWGIARSITAAEMQEMTHHLVDHGVEVKVSKMVGKDDMLSALPPFHVGVVTMRPGRAGDMVMEMQTALESQWRSAMTLPGTSG